MEITSKKIDEDRTQRTAIYRDSVTGLQLRCEFVEYPDDPGSWEVDDQYLFGADMLVAPLLENVTQRNVYLPPGQWVDYQSRQVYSGGWHNIRAGEIPIVVLVKSGSAIPHIKLAQSTAFMDWSKLELVVYAPDKQTAEGLVCLPSDQKLYKLELKAEDGEFQLTENPLAEKVEWTIRTPSAPR